MRVNEAVNDSRIKMDRRKETARARRQTEPLVVVIRYLVVSRRDVVDMPVQVCLVAIPAGAHTFADMHSRFGVDAAPTGFASRRAVAC